jgi:hypothetical protein
MAPRSAGKNLVFVPGLPLELSENSSDAGRL